MEKEFVWTDELVERAIIWCLQYKELLNMEMMKDEFAKGFDKNENITVQTAVENELIDWTNELKIKFFNLAYMSSGFLEVSELFKQFIASEKRKPLFTTEDGIFEGDTIYYIVDSINVCETKVFIHNARQFKNAKTFSTDSSAEEYALMNKPCLSVSDVYNILTTQAFTILGGIKGLFISKEKVEEKIKELAKQKING